MSKTLLDDLRLVLSKLNRDQSIQTSDLRQKDLGTPIASVLLCAEALGFVLRVIQDDLSPVGDAKWNLTESGEKFLRFFQQSTGLSAEPRETLCVVATVPLSVRQAFELRNLSAIRTQDCICDLFREATDELLICTPYLDAGIAQLSTLISPAAAVRLVTTTVIERYGTKPHPVLARIAASHPNFGMRYLTEKNAFGSQQTQIHAKLIISNSRRAYVGSANLTETSLLHNLELGVLLEEGRIVQNLRGVFYDVYENFAKPFG